jgi:hypothetical protein
MFPAPVAASELKARTGGTDRLLHGVVAVGEVTLLSAYWKAGKSTWLAHVLKALGKGTDFCGMGTRKARALVVTEESEHRWHVRRQEVGFGDNTKFIIRPFPTFRPTARDWDAFLRHLAALQRAALKAGSPYDLFVFDTLSNLWPVRDENDATQVQEALVPLNGITGRAAVLLNHHLRKGDGPEGTGSRGSGALPAFCDTILELRRFDANNRSDRRRVLTGYGRDDETLAEMVIELGEDGTRYRRVGADRAEVEDKALRSTLVKLITANPGKDVDQLRELWPDGNPPHRTKVGKALADGTADGAWRRTGEGVKGDPWLYWPPRGDA